MSEELAAALVHAETDLRAAGLTGGQAFDALLGGLEAQLGLRDGGADPLGARVAADLVARAPLRPGTDLFGLAYERFFPDLFKGLRGQFFTPPPVAALLWSRLPPVREVLDPTAGSGGLLVEGARRGARARAIELDPRLARLAQLNLRLAGAQDADVRCADFFLAEPAPVEAVVANPPFSVPITDAARLERFDLGRGRARVSSDHLFVEAVERWVVGGGWAGLVLPFSILANRATAPLRERIAAHWRLRAVCALPEGVFRPFGGAAGRAALVWLQRRPAADAPTLWSELRDPGYDVRAKHVRRTSDAEVEERCAGLGWRELAPGAWTPDVAETPLFAARPTARPAVRRQVVQLAGLRAPGPTSPDAHVADLADAVRATGELVPRPPGDERSPRQALHPGDVLVARLRPNLGNVARVPAGGPPLVGSTEWIGLQPRVAGAWLFHALRTPTWREALPLSTGQTRPRTHPDAVLASWVEWPGDDVVERVERLSTRWQAARQRLAARLDALQRAIDDHAAGRIDRDELAGRLAALEAAGD